MVTGAAADIDDALRAPAVDKSAQGGDFAREAGLPVDHAVILGGQSSVEVLGGHEGGRGHENRSKRKWSKELGRGQTAKLQVYITELLRIFERPKQVAYSNISVGPKPLRITRGSGPVRSTTVESPNDG